MAVEGAFEVFSPDGSSTRTPYTHAYILMGPGGDELSLRVTNDALDLTGFDRVPLP